ncbi:MAG: hypothetical protein GY814_10180 [Gammaproteobacteria bacterium]|nr:hypothetical protein [Gammaproteobacteria bacterium]
MNIYEQSEADFSERGMGIGAPVDFLSTCQDRNLLDSDIPNTSFTSRLFIKRADNGDDAPLWPQPMFSKILNWGLLFSNLRKRVQDTSYHRGVQLTGFKELGESGIKILFSDGSQGHCDLLLFADGHNSLGRKLLFPHSKIDYAGYVAWRGSIKESSFPFQDEALIAVHDQGHFMSLYVPDGDGSIERGQRNLTWIWYCLADESQLKRFLTDRKGELHATNLPPGAVTNNNKKNLYRQAEQQLPPTSARIICATAEPFIQTIYDISLPHYSRGSACLLGDASALARPHTGSGAIKAISQAILLAKSLQQHSSLK